MKDMMIAALFSGSTLIAGMAIVMNRPRSLILGWLGVGTLQSFSLLITGFELLGVLNFIFVIATSTVFQIYSALFGTEAIKAAEKKIDRKDWMIACGAGATAAIVLIYAYLETPLSVENAKDLSLEIFSKRLLKSFPELVFVLATTLFLSLVAWGAIGRPGWKAVNKGEMR